MTSGHRGAEPAYWNRLPGDDAADAKTDTGHRNRYHAALRAPLDGGPNRRRPR